MAVNLDAEISLYSGFMTEIKSRSKVVEDTLNALVADRQWLTSMHGIAEAEKAILQVRFMCELLAFSSVAAHSKHGLNKKLLKSWHADQTFRILRNVNPLCFPVPVVMQREPDGSPHFVVQEASLDAKGLEAIYTKCGGLLHRGVIKHALARTQRKYDLDIIFGWVNTIIGLLNNHMILLQKHRGALIATLGDHDQRVHVAYAEADGDFVLAKR